MTKQKKHKAYALKKGAAALITAATLITLEVLMAGCKPEVTSDATASQTAALTFSAGENGELTAKAGDKKIESGAKLEKGTTVEFTATPKSGCKVDKWTVTGGELVSGTGADESTTAKVKVTAETNVKVSFKKNDYSVSFDAQGGTPSPETQTVPYGEKATAPSAMTKEGNDFEGWFNKDGNSIWDFNVNTVTSNVELYAKWKVKEFSVNFGVTGGNGNLTATLDGNNFTGGNVEYGKTVEFSATPISDYKVDSWSITGGSFVDDTGAEGSTTAKAKISGSITVNVKFMPISHVPVGYGDLDNYLKDTASSTDVNYIKVTGLSEYDLKSNDSTKPSPLGEIIKKYPDKKLALKFDDSLKDITDMNNCFQDCTNLIDVKEIPTSVKFMNNCFFGCTGLTKAPVIPANVTLMLSCFKGCTNLTEAPAIPNNVTDMNYCFKDCKNITEAPKLSTKVTNIAGCFEDCTSLIKAPVIPDSVTNISYCFNSCTNLIDASVIPAGVKQMSACYYDCKKITGAVLKCNYDPDTDDFGSPKFTDAFKGCESLKAGSIKVPEGQLEKYKAKANVMGVLPDRFAEDK